MILKHLISFVSVNKKVYLTAGLNGAKRKLK